MRTKNPFLIVEDDMVDVMTIKRAFIEAGIENPLLVSHNGEEALAQLKRGPIPALIFLDLNMPRMNGLEFLENIKSSKEFCSIPVVILTTSNERRDIQESFRLGAAGYMVKPIDYPEFTKMIKTVCEYWSSSEMPILH